MKNIDKEFMENLKKEGYSFEEIERINQSIESLNKGEGIPFEEILKEFYGENIPKNLCIS